MMFMSETSSPLSILSRRQNRCVWLKGSFESPDLGIDYGEETTNVTTKGYKQVVDTRPLLSVYTYTKWHSDSSNHVLNIHATYCQTKPPSAVSFQGGDSRFQSMASSERSLFAGEISAAAGSLRQQQTLLIPEWSWHFGTKSFLLGNDPSQSSQNSRNKINI